MCVCVSSWGGDQTTKGGMRETSLLPAEHTRKLLDLVQSIDVKQIDRRVDVQRLSVGESEALKTGG